jgi:uncharacterized Zn-binding protein involved in type VI secretion
MIAGAVIGAVVAVAVVAAVAATGGLAIVIFAGAIAGGALAANQILKGVKTIFKLPDPTSGVLAMGSLNVFTNSRPAARATLDFALGCSGGSFPFITHPTIPPSIQIPVAEGSKTVTINSQPAARISMMMVCSAKIKTGSENVFIGGPTARTEFVWDITGWMETGFTWLGIGALIGAGVFAAMAGAAAFAGFLAITGGMMLGFEGLGMLGDMIGPGYRDLFQGIAGMGLLLASPKMVPKAPVVEEPTASIFAVRGSTMSSEEAMAAIARGEMHPYEHTGHVGVSIDGGKTIYGFGPNSKMSAVETIQALKSGEKFPGQLTNDTPFFQDALARAGQPGRGGPMDVLKLDIPLSTQDATKVGSVLSKVPNDGGLATPGYEYSFPKAPTPGQCNCATFPFEGLGVPAPNGLPVQGGIKQFVSDLNGLGAQPWNPKP